MKEEKFYMIFELMLNQSAYRNVIEGWCTYTIKLIYTMGKFKYYEIIPRLPIVEDFIESNKNICMDKFIGKIYLNSVLNYTTLSILYK